MLSRKHMDPASEREQLYREDVHFSPSSLEPSHLAINNHDLQELGEELKETEKRNLKDLGMRSKFITKLKELTSIHTLASLFSYMDKKVVSISLLGLLLIFIVIDAFDLSFNQRLGMTSENDNMMLNNFGWSRGRLLFGSLHGTWAKRGVQGNDMIRVDLRKMTGNSDSSGPQKHLSPHNSSEIPAVLHLTRNGKQVKIHCNLIADEKALENWISNGKTDRTSKYLEDKADIQNGTVKPYLPAHKSHKATVGPWIALVSVVVLALGIVVWIMTWCKHQKRSVQQKELELFGGIMGPRGFQLDELAAATSNFAEENKLGRGGFGPVYRGYLRGQDLHVAIKVLSKQQTSQEQSEQGLRKFKAEVKVMTQLRQRNIVKLVGWCDSEERLLFVYELMAQGSLDKHLYDPDKDFNMATKVQHCT
ncbi:unnamed protein product [Urochloa humidicola]